ncbi:MAG: esterase [Bacteroidales bacterium]|nr:esterase [Bacteroidales bacterium]
MNHKTSIINGRECFLSDAINPKYILIQTLGNHERDIFDRTTELIAESCRVPFVLAAFQVFDWNLDLTPWHDDAIDRKAEVGTKTGETLGYVTESLLPALEADYGKLPVILGGYSLGGLFALWSSIQTDRFAAIAAASPSLWIKDWLNYAEAHPVQTGKVYLSLGDQEEHVKNRAIARVGDCVRGEYELLKAQLGRENCTLVWNPGNHFQDGDKRLAAAFSWCIKELEVK